MTLVTLLPSSHRVFQSLDAPETSVFSRIIETNIVYSVAFSRQHCQFCRLKQKETLPLLSALMCTPFPSQDAPPPTCPFPSPACPLAIYLFLYLRSNFQDTPTPPASPAGAGGQGAVLPQRSLPQRQR